MQTPRILFVILFSFWNSFLLIFLSVVNKKICQKINQNCSSDRAIIVKKGQKKSTDHIRGKGFMNNTVVT
jgi:hypothetical protein